MTTKAFQKIYTKISQITKATCSLRATGVGYDELAIIDGKLAQVVKISGDEVTLQVFQGTNGIPTNAEVVFMGKGPAEGWWKECSNAALNANHRHMNAQRMDVTDSELNSKEGFLPRRGENPLVVMRIMG